MALRALTHLHERGFPVQQGVFVEPEWWMDDQLKRVLAETGGAGIRLVRACENQGGYEEEVPGVEMVFLPNAFVDEAAWLQSLQGLLVELP